MSSSPFKGIKATMHAVNQLERASARRRRESIREFKIQQKEQTIQDAAAAVKRYEAYMDTLSSVHKEAMNPIDWVSVEASPAPVPPVRAARNEEQAVHKRANYKPSFFDKLFSTPAKQMAKLDKEVLGAREKDEKAFLVMQKQYKAELAEWEAMEEMAKGVLAKDIRAYQMAIEHFKPFSEISELGSRLEFEFRADNISIDLFVNGDDIIPREIPTQTSTGKPSKKNMPAGRFNEIYQDFVCGCVIRVAREVTACLPLELVVVNAISELLDTRTGIRAHQPILSVAFSLSKLNQLNFESIDPSDSMQNFPHRMKFGKTTGFAPVEKIDPTGMLLG